MTVEHHTYPVLITIAKYRKRYFGDKCACLGLVYTDEFSSMLRLKCKECPSLTGCGAFKVSKKKSKLL